jgi:hypothetical protein
MTEQIAWIAGLSLVGWLMLRPMLPGRRIVNGGVPQPHLAAGPLVLVAPAVFYGGHKSRVLSIASVVLGVTAVVLALASARAAQDEVAVYVGLAISSAIIAITFVFGNWFATRMRLRLDGMGLHSRLLFGEHTLPWKEVSSLSLRYVTIPRSGVRLIYYCVRSPTREFAFPNTQQGAEELRQVIARATGLAWPEPDITPTWR